MNFLGEHWGDVASVLGLLASIVGFVFTLWSVSKSKTASQSAKEAVEDVRERILTFKTVADLTQAVAIMEEIKRLQRARQWRVVLDRYAALRKCIIDTNARHPQLSPEQKSVLTGAVRQLAELEKMLERDVERDGAPKTDVAKVNQHVTRQLDQISEVLAALHHKIGI